MAEASVNPNDSDSDLLQAFRENEGGIALNNSRRTAVFVGIFMMATSSLDWVIFNDRALMFLVIRTTCTVLLGVIFWYLGDATRSKARLKSAAHGIALLPLVSICLMIAVTGGGNSVYYAGLNLILVGLSLLLMWTFWNSLGMILVTFACYSLGVLSSSTVSDFETLVGNSFFLLVTSVFVLAGSYSYERLRFSEFCLRKEVEKSREAMSIPEKMEAGSVPSLQPPAPLAAPMIGTRASGARPLVLIAGDEPDVRGFLRMQLVGVDVIEASDGAEALELTRLRRPQLALLDHMMPEMDGVEVCKRIREDHATRGVAVIILTTNADEKAKLSALEAGANDFLTKPFSAAELALRLENQIATARVRREIMDLNTELHSALGQIKENEVLMVRNEKLSALGRMSAGIIHEINNPLNYVNAGLHALATFTKSIPEKDQPDFVDILTDIREGVERVSQIVIDLRKFTRGDTATSGDADLAEIIGRSRRMVIHEAGKQIAFNLKSPDHAMISGNPNQLVQVFINFFQNSIDAIQERIEANGGEPGTIDVSIDPAGEGWQVTIRDNGIGIPPENLQKIFDPFFTTKDVGKGMGLGLSITHQILQAHKAVIEVDSRPSEFTRFRISFPAARFTPDVEFEPDESVLDPPA